jgi:hypothetical protein
MKKEFNKHEYRYWKSQQDSEYKVGYRTGLLVGFVYVFIIAVVIIAGYLIQLK